MSCYQKFYGIVMTIDKIYVISRPLYQHTCLLTIYSITQLKKVSIIWPPLANCLVIFVKSDISVSCNYVFVAMNSFWLIRNPYKKGC